MPPLLVTDQERCYGPDGRERDCAGSGQDEGFFLVPVFGFLPACFASPPA